MQEGIVLETVAKSKENNIRVKLTNCEIKIKREPFGDTTLPICHLRSIFSHQLRLRSISNIITKSIYV